MKLLHLTTIDSTNAEALRLLSAAQNVRDLDQTVIAADQQSAGRGRLKRAFYSPAKTGVYFTAIYVPSAPIEDPALLTACAAVAVCRSLKEFFNADAKIKWVNDIYLNNKKVCGILAEGHLGSDGKIRAAAIGIGINIYPSDFPADISARAGAVLQVQDGGRPGSFGDSKSLGADNNFSQAQEAGDIRLDLARDVSQKLFEILNDASLAKAALEEYASLSFIVGKEITVLPIIGDESSAYPATVLGIDKKARLLVRLNDGSERALSSGEISIKI